MPQSVFTFSEFKFDSDTGTLTRRNRESRLPEQTARLLQVLLERSNTLVSREEIEQVLWPDESFVNHDQGINVAINRLRQILRDNPKNPQFLRTIPKRGYSFCGEVRILLSEAREKSSPEKAGLSLTVSATATSLETVIPSAEVHLPAWAPPLPPNKPEPPELVVGPGRPRRVVAFSLIAMLALIGVVAFGLLRKPQATEHVSRVGIAPLRADDDQQTRDAAESFRLELSDAVARLPGVQVPAAGAFVSSDPTAIPRIARDLSLDDLLLGSLSKQGEQYDLKFELVRAKDATHLGSFEYSGLRKDLPAICDRLQQDIFHYMQFNAAAPLQLSKGSTNDPQAYEYYLQGEYSMRERNPESLRKSLDEFGKATSRDPNFAAAYAGAAAAYLRLSEYGTDPRNGLLTKAEDFAGRAVKLDPLLAQAHAVLGTTAYKQDRDFARGEAELRQAIRIDPTQAAYRNWLSVLLVEEGRFDEAIEQLKTAENNSPFWPSVFAIEGLVDVYARRDTDAIKAAKHYVDLLPNLPIAHNTMAWVYFDTRHYEEAIKEWREMALLQNDPARVNLENEGMEVFRAKGIRAYATLRLNAISEKHATSQVNDFMPAEWYACAGNPEKTLDELDRLVAANDPFILHLGVDPLFDRFHQDPRFLSILARSGLMVPPSLQHVDSGLCEHDRLHEGETKNHQSTQAAASATTIPPA